MIVVSGYKHNDELKGDEIALLLTWGEWHLFN